MRLISNRMNLLRQRVSDKFTLPERFKGTFIEKWALYWQGLFRDYAEVATGIVKESYRKPYKAFAYGATGYALYQFAEHNPSDVEEFMLQFRTYTNRVITVNPTLQNHETAEYLMMLERALNRNQLRLLSLGICTLLWIDLYDKDECSYAANCPYTKVSVWDFHKRVIDVGFWNQYWRLKWVMYNYDINYL